jgi:hypothetical protein
MYILQMHLVAVVWRLVQIHRGLRQESVAQQAVAQPVQAVPPLPSGLLDNQHLSSTSVPTIDNEKLQQFIGKVLSDFGLNDRLEYLATVAYPLGSNSF